MSYSCTCLPRNSVCKSAPQIVPNQTAFYVLTKWNPSVGCSFTRSHIREEAGHERFFWVGMDVHADSVMVLAFSSKESDPVERFEVVPVISDWPDADKLGRGDLARSAGGRVPSATFCFMSSA
jgi:hypothetical protein